MHRVLVLIALGLIINPIGAKGKICQSMDVRNEASVLEKLKGCTIITGNLTFVLVHNERDENVFKKYSFPELTEILDFLIVFSVEKLTTLRGIFPNLRTIRGRKLFLGFALIIFKVPHLEEIGLTNLVHIGGGVKVDGCPNLCYVDTIDWEAMGATVLDHPMDQAAMCQQQFCPNECGGHCWNNYSCQKSRTKANYCPYYKDGENCVTECPKSKVVSEEAKQCWTKEECKIAFNDTWAFNGTCTNKCPPLYYRDPTVEGGCFYAGKDYKQHCTGNVTIDSLESLEEMYGCTHINGYLELRIDDPQVERDLEKYLGNIVVISGYLQIGRSKVITSLQFLRNLTVIEGEILTNHTDSSLFVYENRKLKTLWNITDDFKLEIRRGNLTFVDNPQLCLSEIEKFQQREGRGSTPLSQNSNGDQWMCNIKDMAVTEIDNNPSNITLSWTAIEGNILGYTVFYTSKQGKTTDENDVCSDEKWEGVFVHDNVAVLKDLTPFTTYTYYIRTYMKNNHSNEGQQTPTYEFTTASTVPSEPVDVTVEALNATSILVTWRAPQTRNGVLIHYIISMYHEKDYLPTIEQRNYCKAPHTSEIPIVNNVSKLAIKEPNCLCLRDERREFGPPKSKFLDDSNYYNEKALSQPESDKMTARDIGTVRNRDTVVIPANTTWYIFTNLQPFSLYVFLVTACNIKSKKEMDEVQCGRSIMAFQRTKKSTTEDLIKHVVVKIDGKDVILKWSKPEDPNSHLVSYNIEYKRTDSEHSKQRFECLTHNEFHGFYKIPQLSSGKYAVRVRAISYGGSGAFSEWKEFEIAKETNSSFVVIISVIVSLLIAFILLAAMYWYYKKKHLDDRNHLITSINPDYAGPIYMEDEWEIDRKDVDILAEIGQGSFGMVYEGLIKSRRYPCAIKTVNESASTSSRMEFLNEGSVMKSFNDAQHVIKLLGIVSRGQPPLVIMELMERGDLKSYLRRCREPSQNLTTNELYRMAAEIADGMAYLSAKKYIHRDLAARNCMVAADRTVKIGDFGMARDVYETDYYKKDTAGLLPVRWMAPESLADGVFTSDSDVWSYGIVLWEMATLAEQPYQGMSNEEVFNFVKNCGKPKRPDECSDMMYEIMSACWMWRPNDRPTFADIVRRLADHVGEDFRLVAFTFSDAPAARHTHPRVYNPPAMLPEDYVLHYSASDDEVNMYTGSLNRPHSSRHRSRRSSPYHISPGSPSSTYLFNSDSS
uniref:receptor protein-tyrosine kinase n=1 Tax=Gnatocerus cornutus TaxID=1553328 RepID=A0A7G1GD31_9CUCU|nr:insulin-like peptide receptor 2 [Gnatocerus cornutus]